MGSNPTQIPITNVSISSNTRMRPISWVSARSCVKMKKVWDSRQCKWREMTNFILQQAIASGEDPVNSKRFGEHRTKGQWKTRRQEVRPSLSETHDNEHKTGGDEKWIFIEQLPCRQPDSKIRAPKWRGRCLAGTLLRTPAQFPRWRCYLTSGWTIWCTLHFG